MAVAILGSTISTTNNNIGILTWAEAQQQTAVPMNLQSDTGTSSNVIYSQINSGVGSSDRSSSSSISSSSITNNNFGNDLNRIIQSDRGQAITASSNIDKMLSGKIASSN